MSLIEQAAKRLDELRRAGVEIPATHGNAQEATAANTLIERALDAHEKRGEPFRADGQVAHISPPQPREPADGPRVHLDLAGMAARGIVTPDAPRSQLADEYRVVKRPLIANARGTGPAAVRNGNLIMVTSAMPREGKTFTAVNLAMSIAMEFDHTVLLVDADVARPSIPPLLGVDSAPGLLDLLVDRKVEIGDVLRRTDIPKLTLLSAGTQHLRATELLASEAMTQLLVELGRRYQDRIVIFDSPPLLVTTESRVLATHMGQIVVVVEERHTTQAIVKQALATIESCPVKLMLLNKGRYSGNGVAYGYGYGYGYGRDERP